MAKINKNELTMEQIERAMACRTPEELMGAAKTAGFGITRDEAEAYMAELSDFELDEVMLMNAAGGRDVCYTNGCALKCVNNL